MSFTQRCAATAVVALVSCAHAPSTPPPERPAVTWPEPPAEPRVRLARVVSSSEPSESRRSFWQRAWRTVVGLERDGQPQGFQRPFGIAPGPAGEILVSDPDARLVTRVRAGAPAIAVECRDHPWSAPMAAALHPDGAVFVADAAEGVVVRVGADGRCAALGGGILDRPTAIAVRGDRIFVADPPSHAVVVLSTSGTAVATIGHHGEGEAALNFPTGVAIDRDGNLLVVDALNFRVARFTTEGRWLGAFGATLGDGGPFALPKGIATGADGATYVSDAQRDVVVVFRPDGTVDYLIGAPGDTEGRFTHPAGVATSGNLLYVADSYGRRLQVFEILGVQP